MKAEDPTRLINGHSGEILYVNDQLRSPSPDAWIGADMTDVHAYPMPGHIQSQAGKARVLGEFGGIGVPIEGHLWDDLTAGWGYDGVVTPIKMKQQYTQMVDSLKVLEQQGLSASIYTQPFDVESEQNGLMTYDREVIKLPVETIRSINEKLWPNTENLAISTKGVSVKIANPNGSEDYQTRLKAYQGGKRDSAFLRSLAILALQQKDKVNLSKVADDYVNQLKDPFDEANLRFIKRTTVSTKDPGFKLFYDNAAKVNATLGKDESERMTTRLMEKDFINPYTKEGSTPDWASISSNLASRYGSLGEEIALQSQVLYAVNNKEWKLYETVLVPWYEKYGFKRDWIGPGLVNNLAWSAFENINNPETLAGVSKMTAKALEQTPDDPLLVDTHANVLYRAGRKEEAIGWEEKAMALNPNEPVFKETLEKMKMDKPTWGTAN
jgi:tetratricopeptide (TPR) repeat protein